MRPGRPARRTGPARRGRATLTDDLDAVRTYQAAMDITATIASPPTIRITAP
ncbi:hypothetical protein ACFW61_34455 [Streptomyces microflavus]|uniref:hypothetical protein n=1 Tax=Streptomyces microflavus TaxID=1919 RepID=UPI003690561A